MPKTTDPQDALAQLFDQVLHTAGDDAGRQLAVDHYDLIRDAITLNDEARAENRRCTINHLADLAETGDEEDHADKWAQWLRNQADRGAV
ncbi:hypothetical protein [Leifsonia sp. Leaf264]|uniref:hypothetical protein n=1 Tax=Leifsonia sp. Leaf264 TaxID=1736314 RepID=UPI000AAF2212|nr:hypothetical protein [Leifsonia sp. Leaf264]